MIELKPCPFCMRLVRYITSLNGYRVACDVCDIYGPRGTSYENAAERWNDRALKLTQDQKIIAQFMGAAEDGK